MDRFRTQPQLPERYSDWSLRSSGCAVAVVLTVNNGIFIQILIVETLEERVSPLT
jgi:hypothetical protein